MKRLWPWSRGAPTRVVNGMAERMSPHPGAEGAAYDAAHAAKPAATPQPAELPQTPTVQESLFRAAQGLETVAAHHQASHAWQVDARRAVRASIVAVERHLDSTHGESGLEGDVLREEPRLIPAVEHLQADLARVLVELWEADRAVPADNPAFVARLAKLADLVRAVGNEEFSLVHEFFNEPGAMD